MLDQLKRHDLLLRMLATCLLAALLVLLARSGPSPARAPAAARTSAAASNLASAGLADEAIDWVYQDGRAVTVSACARLQGSCSR